MERKLKILIVEDEEPIRRGLVDVFVYHGYDVAACATGSEGLSHALQGGYDLLLLDVMLPGIDGFSICNQVRERDREQPIIMLTAKTSEQDIITGLKLGADDYIAKPFSIQELVLRVEAVLRRSQRLKRENEIIEVGSWQVDCAALAAKSEKEEIELTRKEVEILRFLRQNMDRPVSRGELLQEVWGYRKAASVDTRTVDIHIAKLRKKIELDPAQPELLVTVRGEGYQLSPKKQAV